MGLSFENAFAEIKRDEKWISKILIGGAIGLVIVIFNILNSICNFAPEEAKASITMLVFLLLPIMQICSIWQIGFIYKSANIKLNNNENNLAKWGSWETFLTGLKAFFGIMAYIMIFGIALIILAIPLGILLFFVTLAIQSISKTDPTLGMLLTSLLCVIGVLLYIVIMIYFAQFMNVAYACYSKTLNFGSMFNFSAIYKIIKNNKKLSFILVLYQIAIGVCSWFVSIFATITIIGAPAVMFLGQLIFAIMLTQYAKEVEIEKYLTNEQ